MKFVTIILCLTILFSTMGGCGNTKTIDGVEYDTYGLLNQADKKNPDIEYKLIFGNIVWGIVLIETIIAPIYFFGFSIYEPERKGVLPSRCRGVIGPCKGE